MGNGEHGSVSLADTVKDEALIRWYVSRGIFHGWTLSVVIKVSLPPPMAQNQGCGGEENEEKAYDLGNSQPGKHEAIHPEAFNPESTEGIEHEIGKKYVAPDYAPSPSNPQ